MTAALPEPGAHRVLLVEDDAISMELLALLLDHDGHEVLRASSGEAALDLLQEADAAVFPDVLLVDMQMPGISGSEVARQVRERHGLEPLLLAMSATEIAREAIPGFDGFLLKPLALEDLRKAFALKKRKRGLPGGRDRARRRAASVPQAGAIGAIDRIVDPIVNPIDEGVFGKLESAMPPGALQELCQVCIADTRTRVSKLKAQVLAGDLTGTPREGHQIKGAASMMGFARVAGLALSLELGSCKEEDTLRLLDDLLSSCDELERILLAGKLRKAP